MVMEAYSWMFIRKEPKKKTCTRCHVFDLSLFNVATYKLSSSFSAPHMLAQHYACLAFQSSAPIACTADTKYCTKKQLINLLSDRDAQSEEGYQNAVRPMMHALSFPKSTRLPVGLRLRSYAGARLAVTTTRCWRQNRGKRRVRDLDWCVGHGFQSTW